MSITVDMVYENGAFRPVQPLALELAEGESVAITVVKAAAKAPLTDEEAARRIKSARSVQEWLEIFHQPIPSTSSACYPHGILPTTS